MPWRRDFPHHEIPHRIQELVDRGLLDDVSSPDDPAPSFAAKLLKHGWLRLWVEHPLMEHRQAGPWRYYVEVVDDLTGAEGRMLFQDNNLAAVWPTLITNLKILGAKSRFRLMGGGGRKISAREYFGSGIDDVGRLRGHQEWFPTED